MSYPINPDMEDFSEFLTDWLDERAPNFITDDNKEEGND